MAWANVVLGVKTGAPTKQDVEDGVILRKETERYQQVIERRAARAMPTAAQGASPDEVTARKARIDRITARIAELERDLQAIVADRGIDTAP